jgi:hypothetical protein
MPKTLFEHLNAIYTDQSTNYFDLLDEADKKTYQVYMINRFISMVPAYLPFANEIQQFGYVEPRISYLFFSQLLPKKKTYAKYVKADAVEKYPMWLLDIVATAHKVSKGEAEKYLDIYYLSPDGKEELRSICESYAIEEKMIKKAKL